MDRDGSVLLSRLGGETLTAIGGRYNLTAEAVRLAVIRESRRYIDRLELALLANRQTGEVEMFAIPDHSGPNFDMAIEVFQWSVRELAKRGIETRIHYRPVENGICFGVEDVTDHYGGGER